LITRFDRDLIAGFVLMTLMPQLHLLETTDWDAHRRLSAVLMRRHAGNALLRWRGLLQWAADGEEDRPAAGAL
jgi:hypothetical protein